MLCKKFGLIPTNIFQVMAIFKNEPFSEKYPVQGDFRVIFKNDSEITPQFLLHFPIHIDVPMLCRVFELYILCFYEH